MRCKLFGMLVMFFTLLGSCYAKSEDQLKLVTVSSMEQLIDIKDWDGLYVLLKAEGDAVWQAEEGDEVRIKKAKDFVLDGGINPPTILGHTINVKKSKQGKIRNLNLKPGSGLGEDSTVCVVIDDCKDVELEHCSFSSADGALVHIDESKDCRVEHCLFYEPLQGGKALVVEGSDDIRVSDSLFVSCNRGSPLLLSDGKKGELEMRRSAVVNYGERGSEFSNGKEGAKKLRMRLRENLYVAGENSVDAIYVESVAGRSQFRLELADNEDARGTPLFPHLESDDNIEVTLEGRGNPVVDLEVLVQTAGAVGSNDPDDQRIKSVALNQ